MSKVGKWEAVGRVQVKHGGFFKRKGVSNLSETVVLESTSRSMVQQIRLKFRFSR